MHASWKLWTDAWQIGFDAQRVIALRLGRISVGGAAAECWRMVSEKITTAAGAQAAAVAALERAASPVTEAGHVST